MEISDELLPRRSPRIPKVCSLTFVAAIVVVASASTAAAEYDACMARAQAIQITAQVRDNGVSRHEYETGYAKQWGRPPNAAENEVLTIVYATPNYSPAQLYQITVAGCQRLVR